MAGTSRTVIIGIVVIVAAGIGIALAAVAPTQEEPAAVEKQTHAVIIPDRAGIPGCEDTGSCYTPTEITINAGDSVVWINEERLIPHTVVSGDLNADDGAIGLAYPNGFDSDYIPAGKSLEMAFENAGTYPYYCQLHTWMVGTVTVS